MAGGASPPITLEHGMTTAALPPLTTEKERAKINLKRCERAQEVERPLTIAARLSLACISLTYG